MVADINIDEVTKASSTYIKSLEWGVVPAARAVRLQIWERHVAANTHQGLHYTDFSGQEDPPMYDVALFGGAHICNGCGLCCCIPDTLMTMHLYMHAYMLYMETLNPSRY